MFFYVQGGEKMRITVKIGSSSLTNVNGEIDKEKMIEHVQAIAELKKRGYEVMLVSSGAVASGFKQLNYATRPTTVKGKQAAAAVGQSLLIKTYIELFHYFDIIPAQILLTRDDFTNPKSFNHIFNTITELLERGVVPIINENDTVSIAELTFGDNDLLSAYVAGFLHADQLIILTDINGIYSANPSQDPTAVKYDKITELTPELFEQTTSEGSSLGTGGMKSKLYAAEVAGELGVDCFIGRGESKDKLTDIVDGHGDGTYIQLDVEKSMTKKRQWVALHAEPAGTIIVDEGAKEALMNRGKSLLPVGVTRVEGDFSAGDVVNVYCGDELIGKGRVAYDAKTLMSYKEESGETKEIIHRDEWVQIGGILHGND